MKIIATTVTPNNAKLINNGCDFISEKQITATITIEFVSASNGSKFVNKKGELKLNKFMKEFSLKVLAHNKEIEL